MDVGSLCAENPPQELYHYNKVFGFCESFTYLGCDGNGNRFPNATYCETFCIVMGDGRPSPGGSIMRPSGSIPEEEEA